MAGNVSEKADQIKSNTDNPGQTSAWMPHLRFILIFRSKHSRRPNDLEARTLLCM